MPIGNQDIGRCRACAAPMRWAVMRPSGKKNPLDLAVIPLDEVDGPDGLHVKPGVIAYNSATGGASGVTNGNYAQMKAWWLEGRITFHLSHFATCPERNQFKGGNS